MAGGLLKTLGGLLLALGILVAVAGVIAAVAGYSQERDNRERGVFYDRSASEDNQQIMAAGLVALGVGVVSILVSIVLLAAGGSRANNAIRRDIQQLTPAGAASPVLAPLVPESGATASSATGRPSQGGASAPPRSSSPLVPPSSRRTGQNGVRAGVIAAAIGLIALLLLAAFALNQGVLPGGGDSSASRDAPLDEQGFDGSIDATFMQGGGSTGTVGSSNSFDYEAPPETVRLVLNLTWEVAPAGGVETLHLEVQAASGQSLVAAEGRGAVVLSITDPSILGQPLEILVYPRGDGLVVQQEFHLQVMAWETL